MARQIFTNTDSEDLFNPPEGKNPGWIYYLTGVLQFIYLVGFIVGVNIILVSAYVPHTHFRPGQPNNNLYSERYTSLWWMVLFFASMRFLFFLAMQSMFVYRNTRCCGSKNGQGCTVFWMIILVAILALDVAALVINGNFLSTCNTKDAGASNPCNDPKWCCRADVHDVVTNACPNHGMTCPGTLVLERDGIFLGAFALNVVFVALELYFVLMPMVLWFFSSGPPPYPPAGQQQQQKEEEATAEAEQDSGKQAAAEMALLTGGIAADVPLVTSKPVDVKMRRPAPRTPLLVAAAAGQLVHVTPPSSTTTVVEKNTKQP